MKPLKDMKRRLTLTGQVNPLQQLMDRLFISRGKTDSSDNASADSSFGNGSPTDLEIEVVDSNGNKPEKLVCLFDESPYYILKVAAQGNLNEVTRLLNEDPARLHVRDYRGQNIVHHAVSWSRLAVLDYLHSIGISDELNVQDKLGNTALHFAIEKNQIKAVQWLLDHHACLYAKNNQKMAPIHYAVEFGRTEIIKLIIANNKRAVDIPGDMGATALHTAAAKDNAEIARLLLAEGADLMKRDEIGCPPIHSATRNGSANVIDVLLEYAEKRGTTRKGLIHVPDKEQNLPLHSATNSGDIKAVSVCLKAGADIDAQQATDRQTAVHYAAAQGGYELIKLMFEEQPEKQESCIHCRDILEQTPLHKAAMLNHVRVVEQLIDYGASINAQDGERRTPLLLAASKNASDCVNFLLSRRANTRLKDRDNRNFLHILILNGAKLSEISLDQIKDLTLLLNERDDFGCSPLHYASKAGQLGTLRGLLKLGAAVTLKDNEKSNPLHVAAKYGKIQTCRNLLASEQGALLINETDAIGRTPLHVASQYGHFKVIALLVRNGALHTKDYAMQNTPLHLAAEYGHHEAVVLLVSLAPHFINYGNKANNTALHLAAQNGHALVIDYLLTAGAEMLINNDGNTFFDLAILKFQSDACAAIINHQRCYEAMQLHSSFGTPLIGLIQHLPKISLLFLDKCISYSAENRKSPGFYVRYDFRFLQTPSHLETPKSKLENNGQVMANLPMNTMVKFNRVDCLSHPVCVAYLKRKWDTFGSMIYNFRVGIYILFLCILTSLAFDIDKSVYVVNPPPPIPVWAMSAEFHNLTISQTVPILRTTLTVSEMPGDLMFRLIFIIAYCSIDMAAQIVSIFQQKLRYFFDFSHYLEWTLYITTLLATLPFFATEIQDHISCVLIATALSLLLGWTMLLLYMQKFEFFGLYVIMFIEIFKTLMRALGVFSFLIIAFGLSFNLVFRTTDGPTQEFKNPLVSMMSTLSMMVGEANYIHIITPTLDGRRRLVYHDLTYVIFIVFVLLVPTLLMNLLVGLAVGDIESVQKNARLKRLAMQVEYFTTLEGKLPKSIKTRITLNEYSHYPNRARYEIFQNFKNLFYESFSTDKFSDDGGGNVDGGESDSKNDFAYLLEEMTHQSRQMSNLSNKLEAQHDLLRSMLHRLDLEYGRRQSEVDDEIEENGDDDDDDNHGVSQPEANKTGRAISSSSTSNEFHSASSRAHWHVVQARFAAIKKPKTRQIWQIGDEVRTNRRNSSTNYLLDSKPSAASLISSPRTSFMVGAYENKFSPKE